ncbi:MAG TPA: AraC family transcriptional regulator [Bacillota bacterium]|nr:AraC family transcriptional regulator [Bacillota bacterium]
MAVAGEIDDFTILKERYSGSELDALIRSFIDMATAVLNDSAKALIAMVGEGKFVIAFSFEDLHSSQNIYDQVFKTINRLKATIKRYLNITACFGMTGICNEIDQLNQYYQRAEQILSKKFYEGKDRILFDATVAEVIPTIQMLDIKEEKQLLELAKSGAKKELLALIGDIFDQIQRERPNPSATRMVFATLINIVNKVARDSGLQTTTIFRENQDPFEQLKRFDTVNEVRDYIQRIYEGLFETMALYCISQQYDEVTKQALDFMNKNFHEDLSLTEIAGYVGVNSSYLSRKFKKDCGKGIVEYLNALRITRAKQLMEEGDKSIKEIAFEVGFNNYNYFFKVFKDTLGMTPLEYEKAVQAR